MGSAILPYLPTYSHYLLLYAFCCFFFCSYFSHFLFLAFPFSSSFSSSSFSIPVYPRTYHFFLSFLFCIKKTAFSRVKRNLKKTSIEVLLRRVSTDVYYLQKEYWIIRVNFEKRNTRRKRKKKRRKQKRTKKINRIFWPATEYQSIIL